MTTRYVGKVSKWPPNPRAETKSRGKRSSSSTNREGMTDRSAAVSKRAGTSIPELPAFGLSKVT